MLPARLSSHNGDAKIASYLVLSLASSCVSYHMFVMGLAGSAEPGKHSGNGARRGQAVSSPLHVYLEHSYIM